MARATIVMPEDFLMRLSTLEKQTDTIIPRVLEAGGQVVLARVRSNLQAVIGKKTKFRSRSTGHLVSALGLSGARLDREGNYNVKVGFSEHRPDGIANAKIANVLEYGKHGQPAKPFLKPAKSQAKDTAVAAMVAKLEEEVAAI